MASWLGTLDQDHAVSVHQEAVQVLKGNAKRIGMLAGATLLTVGLAGPALANGTAAQGTSHTATSPTRTAPTLAQMKSWITAKIDAHLSWIEKAEAG